MRTLLPLLAVLLASGCQTANESANGKPTQPGPITCAGTETGGVTFPVSGAVSFVHRLKHAKTTILEGYAAAGLDDTFKNSANQLVEANYRVVGKSKRGDRATIRFARGSTRGTVVLRDACSNGATSVRITY